MWNVRVLAAEAIADGGFAGMSGTCSSCCYSACMYVLHGALRSGPGIGIAVFLCLLFFNAARPAWSSALPAWLHVYNHYVSTCDHTNSFKKCCCCLLLRSAIHSANIPTDIAYVASACVPVCVWEVGALRSPGAELAAWQHALTL